MAIKSTLVAICVCVSSLVTISLCAATQESKQKAETRTVSKFGAIALSGDTAVLGAPGESDSGTKSGAAYIFTRSGTTWTQQAKLIADDAAPFVRFGASVAIDGNTASILSRGQRRRTISDTVNPGSAYIFTRTGSTWIQQAKLSVNSARLASVALSGDTAIIGAPYEDSSSGEINIGAAYIFTRSGATWTQQAKLTADDPGSYDFFGSSVALSGDTAIIGAPFERSSSGEGHIGAAYIFTRSGATWTQQARLTADDMVGNTTDYFGQSIDIQGDTVVVGAYGQDTTENLGTGAVYVFTRSGTTWTQQTKLTNDNAENDDRFGVSVAIDDETLVVGCHFCDNPNISVGDDNSAGAVFVYTRSGTSWTQQAKLTADDPGSYDYFGRSVALDGDSAAVGSTYRENVNVYSRTGATWRYEGIYEE